MAWELDLYHCTFGVEHPFMDAQHSLCGTLKCHIQEWKRCSSAWHLVSRIANEGDQFYSESEVEITAIDSFIESLLRVKENIFRIMECSDEDTSKWEDNDHIIEESKVVALGDYDITDICTYSELKRLLEFIDDVVSIMRYYPQNSHSYYQFKCADW